MISTQPAPRLIRVATLLLALFGGSLVFLAYEPRIVALQTTLEDTESELRSDDIAFAEVPRLRAERARLATHYEHLFGLSSEATFLRELATAVRRRGVDLVSTTVVPTDDASQVSAVQTSHFKETHLLLQVRGSYSNLLATVVDLSMESELVRIAVPTMRREGNDILATVPVTLLVPSPAVDR
jgi:hypothetical protein